VEGNELVANDLEARLPHQPCIRVGRKAGRRTSVLQASPPVQASVSPAPTAVISRPQGTSQRWIRANRGASSSRGT
jgi:hypothetical protein